MTARDTVYRTFIAIEFPQQIRARIVEHIRHLRHEVPQVRAGWSHEDNLHLTLKFLGNVRLDDIANVSAAVERVTPVTTPFPLRLSGCGTFPPHGRPSVLWIGIEPGLETSKLQDLHEALERECSHVGFPRELRPFHPHLTIARLRKPQGARRLAELHQRVSFPAQTFNVSEIVVFRSELLKAGSKHTAISRHALRLAGE